MTFIVNVQCYNQITLFGNEARERAIRIESRHI